MQEWSLASRDALFTKAQQQSKYMHEPCLHDPTCQHLDTSAIMLTCDNPVLYAARAYAMDENVTCFHAAVMRPSKGPSGDVVIGKWGA